MPCRYPEHHRGAAGGPGVLVIAALAVAAYVAVRLVLAAVRFVATWWWVPVVALAAGAVSWIVARRIYSHHVEASKKPSATLSGGFRPPKWLRHLPRAVWAATRWHHLTRNLGLAAPDRHRPGKVRHPRAIILPGAHGVTARVRTVPGTGRAELDAAAEHIGNAWRCPRVSVSQPRPGRVVVRGMRRDPLLVPFGLDPDRQHVADLRRLYLGRDEHGADRYADLANLSGSAFSGNPGMGKTEAALSLACQLAVSPLVDTWILDGGACDWAPFAAGAAGYVGDDLEAAEDMLRVLDASMCDRRRNLQADRGVRNGWATGPAVDYRLQWVLVEEAPFYLDEMAVRGDHKREGHVRACRGLLAGLLRRGRAPLFHTTLIAQKGTGTAGLPPDLRDLCGLRWSFGVATTDAAAAILGDDIRQHATMSPVLLQDMTGVASVLMRTGQSPYTLVRFPAIGQDRADRAAASLAARTAAAVPGDVPELAVS